MKILLFILIIPTICFSQTKSKAIFDSLKGQMFCKMLEVIKLQKEIEIKEDILLSPDNKDSDCSGIKSFWILKNKEVRLTILIHKIIKSERKYCNPPAKCCTKEENEQYNFLAKHIHNENQIYYKR